MADCRRLMGGSVSEVGEGGNDVVECNGKRKAAANTLSIESQLQR
jgi:hypothetical protein